MPPLCSPHFTLRELVASQTATRQGIDNTPSMEVEGNLSRLCNQVLERIRFRFGPVRVTSGYRCRELNAAIGGSVTSAHMDGRAADFESVDTRVSHRAIVDWVVAEMRAHQYPLPVDQVIYEYEDGWVHVGIAEAGKEPRREALMIFKGTGYLPYDPRDPRVK